MASRRRPDPEPTLSIFPGQIHIGDRFTDAETGDEPHEWEVVSRPVTFKKGHEVRARVQRPSDPGTAREKSWAAHEKITVRRGTTAATNRSIAEPEGAATDVDALRREVRRLRGEVLRLEDDKRGPRPEALRRQGIEKAGSWGGHHGPHETTGLHARCDDPLHDLIGERAAWQDYPGGRPDLRRPINHHRNALPSWC